MPKLQTKSITIRTDPGTAYTFCRGMEVPEHLAARLSEAEYAEAFGAPSHETLQLPPSENPPRKKRRKKAQID